jgi:hypothetical protein
LMLGLFDLNAPVPSVEIDLVADGFLHPIA